MKRAVCWLTSILVVTFPHLAGIYSHSLRSAAVAAERHNTGTGAGKAPALVTLPGPLPSFLRMAAIGAGTPPEEVLTLLARNVASLGYKYTKRKPPPTEYLILLKRYLDQVFELQKLADPDGQIRIAGCSESAPLLAILGYRPRQPCGPDLLLGAEDSKRAFLTMNSGFPLLQLEEALRADRTFTYDFSGSELPVLTDPGDWSADGKDVVSSLIDDPELSRLYVALGRLDEETRTALLHSVGLRKLLPRAAALDFYGAHIQIRSGRVLVPGGAPAEPAWRSLVGAGADAPVSFITRLLDKDDGWLAAFFDSLARAPRPQRTYFTDGRRLPRFYAAWRGRTTDPGAASSTFRPAPGLLLLISRLSLGADGQPQIPGSLEVWKDILRQNRDSDIGRTWSKRATGISRSEQLIEAMVGLARSPVRDEAFEAFTVLNEIDRRRTPGQALSADTIRLLAVNYSHFSSLYPFLTEWSELDDESVALLFVVAKGMDAISNDEDRANAIGILQALLGLWQILARQGQIDDSNLNQSWRAMIRPLAGTKSPSSLVDATRSSLAALNQAASGRSTLSQNEFILMLAGPNQDARDRQRVREQLANRMGSVMEAQRLVSLDALFELEGGLKRMAAGEAVSKEALLRLAGDLREFEPPEPIFSRLERSQWTTQQFYAEHSTLQSRTNLTKIFAATSVSEKDATDAIGRLIPFIRDTLVGLNYAYYEPPGSEVLHVNSMLVRSHDFSEVSHAARKDAWQPTYLTGRGVTAGGGTHLAGSLTDLPYVLSRIEQEFIVPESVQALVWGDLAPSLLANATLPRWWHVTANELHAVALYQRFGEELITASARDVGVRQNVLEILSDRLYPRRLIQVEDLLVANNTREAATRLTPSEMFFLANEFRRRHPQTDIEGSAGKELQALARQVPGEVSQERISVDFGVPHPAMAHTYRQEMLELELFPTFFGYSSRLMAESWESNNLYWARLADEAGYAPVMLHYLVPVLTRRMIEKISGTHLEDWPAVLRALRQTGEEFRSGKIGIGGETKPISVPR